MIFPPTVCTSGKQGVSTSEETLNVKGLKIGTRRWGVDESNKTKCKRKGVYTEDIQKSDVVRAQSRASNRERRRGGAASRDLKVVSCEG